MSPLGPADRDAFRRVGTHLPAVDLMTTRDFLWVIGRAVEVSALCAEDARLPLAWLDILDRARAEPGPNGPAG